MLYLKLRGIFKRFIMLNPALNSFIGQIEEYSFQIVYNKVRNLGQKKAIENSKMLVTTTNKKGKDNGQEERYYIF